MTTIDKAGLRELGPCPFIRVVNLYVEHRKTAEQFGSGHFGCAFIFVFSFIVTINDESKARCWCNISSPHFLRSCFVRHAKGLFHSVTFFAAKSLVLSNAPEPDAQRGARIYITAMTAPLGVQKIHALRQC